jgi:transposase-like protein
MKYEQGVTEWHFVTSYCPVCGSQRIETEGGPVDDFHCKDCDSLFDVMVDIETLSEKNDIGDVNGRERQAGEPEQ